MKRHREPRALPWRNATARSSTSSFPRGSRQSSAPRQYGVLSQRAAVDGGLGDRPTQRCASSPVGDTDRVDGRQSSLRGRQERPALSASNWSGAARHCRHELARPSGSLRTHWTASDLNNFGSRVSAAWTPHAKSGFFGWLDGSEPSCSREGKSATQSATAEWRRRATAMPSCRMRMDRTI